MSGDHSCWREIVRVALRNQGQAETSVHGGTGSAWGYVETGEAAMQVQSSRSNSSGPNRLLEKRQQNSER